MSFRVMLTLSNEAGEETLQSHHTLNTGVLGGQFSSLPSPFSSPSFGKKMGQKTITILESKIFKLEISRKKKYQGSVLVVKQEAQDSLSQFFPV